MVVRGADLAAYPQAHRLAPARIVAEREHAQLQALPGRGPREAGRKGWGRLDPGRSIAAGPRTDRRLVLPDGPGSLTPPPGGAQDGGVHAEKLLVASGDPPVALDHLQGGEVAQSSVGVLGGDHAAGYLGLDEEHRVAHTDPAAVPRVLLVGADPIHLERHPEASRVKGGLAPAPPPEPVDRGERDEGDRPAVVAVAGPVHARQSQVVSRVA